MPSAAFPLGVNARRNLPRPRTYCEVLCARDNSAVAGSACRTARRLVAATPSAQGQRVRVWANSVGQPSLWRTIAIVALPSTTCSGTALQCVQVNTAATVSVCLDKRTGNGPDQTRASQEAGAEGERFEP